MQLSNIQTLDIIKICEHYNIKLTPSSDRFVTNCIFHSGDNTPSLTIYPKTQSFYCFSCKKSGDALTIISFMENISIYEVKKRLGTDFLRYSLSKQTKKSIDFFQALLKDSSNIFYEYIRTFPDREDYTMQVMQQLDMYINELTLKKTSVDFTLYTKVLDNLKKLLYNKFINK